MIRPFGVIVRESCMTRKSFLASHLLAITVIGCVVGGHASAHEKKPDEAGFTIKGENQGAVRADGHAPIGVMGDHMHHEGEWMLSYRYMSMVMRDNLDGDSKIDAATIATTVPNRFFGAPGQPPTLRVVPTDMRMEMHMFGMMYAPTDWLTLMGMANYVVKDMDHITFAGGAGTAVLGVFNVKTQGFGDTRVSGLVRLFDGGAHHLHLNLGVSLPTGSVTEQARILAPNGATPTLRVPYAMQLGTGTVDLLPGLTYTGRSDPVGWGAQITSAIHPYRNSEGYAWGDKYRADVWGSYQWASWISTSLRLGAQTEGRIRGIDPQIAVPNQTADPDNYGGEQVDLSLGLNLAGQGGDLRNLRIALEATAPVYQNLNGPQMQTDLIFTLGVQYAW